MKRLHLLKPNLCTGYLEDGNGQRVEYLQLDPGIGEKELSEDVKLGAKQFAECEKLLKKGGSRFVIIDCKTKEEGLAAVSYLAGARLTEKEIPFVNLEEPRDFVTKKKELTNTRMQGEWDDDFQDDWDLEEDFFEEDEEEEGTSWEEVPEKIPVIDFTNIADHSDHQSSYMRGPFRMMGDTKPGQKPYWFSLKKESVCITHYSKNLFPDLKSNANLLDRFLSNKYVYFLSIRGKKEADEFYVPDTSEENVNQELLCLALSYTADIVSVNTTQEGYVEYENLLFDSWTNKYDYQVARSFPKREVVKKIISINDREPSITMEKVMLYLRKDCWKTKLTKEDFAFLQKFATNTETEKDPQKALESDLVGMSEVKQQIREIVQVMKYSKYRQEAGLGSGDYHNVHLLIGAPGTAKTTVAKLLGNMMCREHLLPGNRFTAINGADLKALYVGHSAPKTHQLFEQNDVIFIDEAYSIVTEDEPDSFSQEALAQLVIELENHAMDKLVIFAGYGGIHVDSKNNKMKKFIDANPGIKSRINSTIYFESYDPDAMLQIVHSIARKQKYQLTHQCDEEIKAYFANRVKDVNFGNGREARSLLEHIVTQAASRLAGKSLDKLDKKTLSQLTREDVQCAIRRMEKDSLMQTGKTRSKLGFGTTA